MSSERSFDVEYFRRELEECSTPIYFFHDDPDGLASYLILKKVKDGVGVPVKSRPVLTEQFAGKVVEVGADKVFVLDVAMIDESFLDSVKVPVVWLDHHAPVRLQGVKYFNPQLLGKNIPTPVLCFEAVHQGLWLAVLGAFSEWFIPEFLGEFEKEYSSLLPKTWNSPGDVIYSSELGKLIEVFSFSLKGETSAVKKNMKLLGEIKTPFELLSKESKQAVTVWKHHAMIRKEYDSLLLRALRCATSSKLLLFTYESAKFSLTRDLANELSYRYPEKVVILARRQSGEFRCSFRSQNLDVRELVEKSLRGLQGYSGGHEAAAGGAIREEDFGEFLGRIERELSESKP